MQIAAIQRLLLATLTVLAISFSVLPNQARAGFDARNREPGCPATTYLDEKTKTCLCSAKGSFYFGGKCRPEKKIRTTIIKACKKVGAVYDENKAVCNCQRGRLILPAKEGVQCSEVFVEYDREADARLKSHLRRVSRSCETLMWDESDLTPMGVPGKWRNGRCECPKNSRYDSNYSICLKLSDRSETTSSEKGNSAR